MAAKKVAKKKARASVASGRTARSATTSERSAPQAVVKPVRGPAVARVAKKAAKKATIAKPEVRAARHSAAEAAAVEPAPVLDAGDVAPRFQLLDHAGEPLASRDLAGQPYVLYFYPKDDTPGCTTQACGFRDALPAFERLGVRVLGVSPDSAASHQRFRGKYSLPFSLLVDSDKELATAYGVWAKKKNYGREYMGVVRSTFLVGADGVIRNVWRSVKVNGHVDQVQAAAAELG